MAGRPDALNTAAGLQFTPEGQPYYLTQSGQRSFLPPLVAAQERDPRAQAWARAQGTSIAWNPDGTAQVSDTSRPGESMWQNAGTWNDQKGTWDRGFNWNTVATLGAGAIVAAPAVGALLGSGSAAAAPAAGGGGATGAGTAGATSAGLLPNTANLGAWYGTAAPTVTAAGGSGGMGLWSTVGNFLRSPAGAEAVRTGGDVAGTIINGRQQGKATDAQLQGVREALAFERDVYDRAQRDYEPWKALTGGVVNNLQTATNTPRPPVTAAGVYESGQLPQVGVGAMLGGGSRQASPAMVRMQDPTTGETRMVRPDAVAKYEARGAVRL